ncbi:MAG TPA: response regulator transcription factor [Chloroflexota bacterium]
MVEVLAPRRVVSGPEPERWGEAGLYRPIRVLLVESRSLVRDAYRSLVEANDSFTVIGEAGDVDSALNLAARLQPAIILFNADLARSGLASMAANFREQAPSAKMLLIATDGWVEDACGLVEQGSAGFVLTESTGTELLMALREVHEHGVYVAAGATRRLFGRGRRNQTGPRALASRSLLTNRERELLRLIADGRPNREIAAELYISVRTVEAHKARMISRLGLRNTTELLRYAVQTSRDGMA